MREVRDLVAAWRALPVGGPAVLATVVATRGSTYRRAGARMLLSGKERLAGSISGGCLESDLLQSAWDRTSEGPVLVTYDATSSEDLVWGFGLGCTGVIEVLLERLPPTGGALAFLEDRIKSETAGVLVTVISPGPFLSRQWRMDASLAELPRQVAEASEPLLGSTGTWVGELNLEGQPVTMLFEAVLPPFRLGIFGAGFDASPLIDLADQLGWTTVLFDNKATYANPERFPRAGEIVVQAFGSPLDGHRLNAAVTMSHNYLNDLAVLRQLAPLDLPYIGLLGPRARGERLLADLKRDGLCLSAEHRSRFRTPVGLDLGAEGPYEIALSIVAEIQAVYRSREGTALSASGNPLPLGERAGLLRRSDSEGG